MAEVPAEPDAPVLAFIDPECEALQQRRDGRVARMKLSISLFEGPITRLLSLQLDRVLGAFFVQ
jgi:hypothetical protein